MSENNFSTNSLNEDIIRELYGDVIEEQPQIASYLDDMKKCTNWSNWGAYFDCMRAKGH